MTNRENVKRAVNFDTPQRVPIYFFNKDLDKSDVTALSYKEIVDDDTGLLSEWGFVWEKKDDTMGQPKNAPLKNWGMLPAYAIPNPHDPRRFTHFDKTLAEMGDKYRIATLGISGFNRVTFIRGFENTLEDLYFERDNIEKLIDIVFDFEREIIKEMCRFDIDAIGFGDDWGSQSSLMINPDMWREIFKPRYRKQFDLAHSYGKHVFFHSCGYIYDIIPDFIELGVDILNLNQPDIFGIERLGEEFAGRVCFNCPADHQTVAIFGTANEINDYAQKLNTFLNTPKGGFIANIEEYSSIGMSEENYKAIVRAFENLRIQEG